MDQPSPDLESPALIRLTVACDLGHSPRVTPPAMTCRLVGFCPAEAFEKLLRALENPWQSGRERTGDRLQAKAWSRGGSFEREPYPERTRSRSQRRCQLLVLSRSQPCCSSRRLCWIRSASSVPSGSRYGTAARVSRCSFSMVLRGTQPGPEWARGSCPPSQQARVPELHSLRCPGAGSSDRMVNPARCRLARTAAARQ